MTSAQTLLSGRPGPAPRVHATEADYKAWVYEYIPHPAARWHRMLVYRALRRIVSRPVYVV